MRRRGGGKGRKIVAALQHGHQPSFRTGFGLLHQPFAEPGKVFGFATGLLIVSAGFDGHKEDPLAHFRLEAEDFAWLSERLVEQAEASAKGRLVSVLEGGYDLPALAASAAAHVRALLRY